MISIDWLGIDLHKNGANSLFRTDALAVLSLAKRPVAGETRGVSAESKSYRDLTHTITWCFGALLLVELELSHLEPRLFFYNLAIMSEGDMPKSLRLQRKAWEAKDPGKIAGDSL